MVFMNLYKERVNLDEVIQVVSFVPGKQERKFILNENENLKIKCFHSKLNVITYHQRFLIGKKSKRFLVGKSINDSLITDGHQSIECSRKECRVELIFL